MELLELLMPNVGTGLVRIIGNMINIACLMSAVVIWARFLLFFFQEGREGRGKKAFPKWMYWAASTLTMAALIGIAFFGSRETAPTSRFYDLAVILQDLGDILDPMLDTGGLLENPITDFLGINLLLRAFLLCTIAAVFRFTYRYAARTASRFYIFLNEKILSQDLEEKKEEEDQKWADFLVKVIKWIMGGFGLTVITYIVGAGELRDGIQDFLGAAYMVLEKITVLDQLSPANGTLSGYFNNIVMVLLSLLILAVYLTVFLLLAAFLLTIIKNWEKIVKGIEEHRKQLLKGTVVTLLMVFSISVIIGLSGLLRSQIFQDAVNGGPEEMLATAANIAVLFFALFLILVLLFFLLAFLTMVVAYAYRTAENFIRNRRKDKKETENPVGGLLGAVAELFTLLVFAVKEAVRAIKGFISTALQIFTGYRNESEKNQAIFLAACFASLASLLNTFFGLNSFYNAAGNGILTVCALAISFAVQLAMLIFGMRAGEGRAERKKSGENKEGSQKLSWMRYLLCYLFLLVISTGFAFTNLFGYYADGARIYQRVYDQIHYETENELGLVRMAEDLVTDYQKNENDFLKQVKEREKNSRALREQAVEYYQRLAEYEAKEEEEKKKEGKEGSWFYRHQRIAYLAVCQDMESVTSAIQTVLEMDPARIGENAVICVEQYKHYVGTDSAPTFQTVCIKLDFNDKEEDKAAVTADADDPSEEIHDMTVGTAAGEENGDNLGRYVDPNGESFSIAKSVRMIKNADKITILRELLAMYDQVEDYIYSVRGFDGKNNISEKATEASTLWKNMETTLADAEKNRESAASLLGSYLDQNKMITVIYDNVAELVEGDTEGKGGTEEKDPFRLEKLPRMVLEYLNGEEEPTEKDAAGENAAGEETTEATEKSDRERGYESLSSYIDRALILYDFLSGYQEGIEKMGREALTEEEEKSGAVPAEGAEETGTAPETEQKEDPAYRVRQYQNYAQGITHSNFQVSFDALLCGHLNSCSDTINALYEATPVAFFILLICALIDLLSFFAGMLLFKSIYFFEKNDTIERVGYLDYEAALIQLFTPPQAGEERLLHLAFLYEVLHGLLSAADAAEAKTDKRLEPLYDIMNSQSFKTFSAEKKKALKELKIGGNESSYAQLQLWLTGFVAQQEIDMEPLFSAPIQTEPPSSAH